ncbi:MAG: hypothetical protein QX188_05400, partial [Methylococcaceae bacterium]
MSETMKVMLAVAGMFIAGSNLVALSKEEPFVAHKEAASSIRHYVKMQPISNQPCRAETKKGTNYQGFFPSESK